MPIDFAELARMVRRDRGESVSQTDYGKSLGLAQGQISDLELAKTRRLSHEVRVALEKRFGVLPQIGATRGDEPVVDSASPDLATWDGRIKEHLGKQVGLLSDMRGLIVQQGRSLAEQGRQIAELRREVAHLAAQLARRADATPDLQELERSTASPEPPIQLGPRRLVKPEKTDHVKPPARRAR